MNKTGCWTVVYTLFELMLSRESFVSFWRFHKVKEEQRFSSIILAAKWSTAHSSFSPVVFS